MSTIILSLTLDFIIYIKITISKIALIFRSLNTSKLIKLFLLAFLSNILMLKSKKTNGAL